MVESGLGRTGALNGTRAKRILPYTVLLAAACWLLFLTRSFDYDRTAGSLGPEAWPGLILLLMIAASLFEIGRLALFWRGGDVPPVSLGADVDATGDSSASYLHAACGLACIAAYLLMLPYAGFFLATFVFLCAYPAVAGYRSAAVILPVAILLTMAFMFLFMRVIYVSLPIGIDPFATVSLLVMKLLGVS